MLKETDIQYLGPLARNFAYFIASSTFSILTEYAQIEQIHTGIMDTLLAQSSPHFMIGILLGVFSHLNVFIKGEWHKSAPGVFMFHTSIAVILLIVRFLALDDVKSNVFGTATVVFFGYVLGLLTSMISYRVYFHPLARHGFKGPRYARMTKLWHSWANRHGQNHLLLEGLRGQYGDFVRTGKLSEPSQKIESCTVLTGTRGRLGPAELTVFHPAVFAAIDGPKTDCVKGEWYDIFYPDMQSIVTCRDKAEHTAHRREWSKAFLSDGKWHEKP